MRHVEWYKVNFYATVTKMVTGKGTKVYLDGADPFELSYYKGPKLKVGDYLVKQGGAIAVYRTILGERVHVADGIAVKPAESYLDYFFF